MRATVVSRTRKDGSQAYRVGWRTDGRLRWSPTIETGEGAVEFKALVERLGPDAALAILRQRTGRDTRQTPLLSEVLERHLRSKAGALTPGTIAGYRSLAANTWLPRLGDYPVTAITREVVEDWVAWQREQETKRGTPFKPKSIHNAHGLLSAVLATAAELGLIPKNPARGVGLPDDDVDAEMDVLDADEWEAFIGAMDPHYRPLTWFLLAVGCRIGEALAVQVRDLDLARSTVRIRRAWKKGERGVYLGSTKSKRSKRTVLLPRELADDLAQLVQGKPADAFVFTTRTGRKVDTAHFRERQWARAIKAAGITKRITPHSLRHTSASWLLAEGVSPITVQHRLGHESLATTSKVYAHLLTDAQVGAAAVMGRATPRPQIEA